MLNKYIIKNISIVKLLIIILLCNISIFIGKANYEFSIEIKKYKIKKR